MPGSKSKPKPRLHHQRARPLHDPLLPRGPTSADVVVSITKFCNKHNISLCVLSNSGSVANVTLYSRFDLLCLSATVLPPNFTTNVPSIGSNGFNWK
ncbi:hypothetical protein RHSIM_Rhsim11G0066700 [Rhododendron simsii]|uniref:Uncharacterized protein n=1 Tax=Rhododendron simsii TaxID=118357 RepID=A0A834GBL0_RHOSS|nr:hypothetical protein RHSIM_Rhsim11G0066700 [Rhododendron simsii]